jgi:hypothetical protein
MVSVFSAAHAWKTWGCVEVNVMLFDFMELNLYPVATYAAVRFVNTNLQRIGVRAVYTLFHRLGGTRVLQRRRFWNGAAAVISQMLVGGLLCWVLTVGPVQLPMLLDPLALMDEGKERVLRLLNVLAEPVSGRTLCTTCSIAIHQLASIAGRGMPADAADKLHFHRRLAYEWSSTVPQLHEAEMTRCGCQYACCVACSLHANRAESTHT